MTIATFFLSFSVLLIITLDGTGPEEKQSYVPKRLRPHKSTWIKSMITFLLGCAEPLVATITNIKVRRRCHIQGTRRMGPRRCRYKKVPRDRSAQKSIPVMTTTWTNWTHDIPPGRQFLLRLSSTYA